MALFLTVGIIGAATAAETGGGEGPGAFGAFAASKEWIPPTDPAVLEKLRQWQDRKVGLLIHWGPYSQWGIVESWSLVTTHHPWNQRPQKLADLDDRAYQKAYENLMTTFNPTQFDPDHWAKAAKDGGMKYVVFTTKHHDGFCMWDTATTDYKITSTRCPYHTNPRSDAVKEIMRAFRAQGLSTGLYFSKADWNHPGFWIRELGPGPGQGPNYNPRTKPELWKQFKDFTWRQIEELVSGYGPQDILWLDAGSVRPPDADIDMNGLAAMARRHQPGLIVVDRTVHGPNENYITPEGEIPDHYLPYPWETCMTMGHGWTWRAHDEFKSAGTLIRNLCRIVARNGNYLIGIGPSGAGDFDPGVYERLREIGAWLQVNGSAIYGTRPAKPYEQGDCVFTKSSDGTVYAIVLGKDDAAQLPEKVALPKEIAAGMKSATLLGYGPVSIDSEGNLTFPEAVRAKPPCAHAWAVKLSAR